MTGPADQQTIGACVGTIFLRDDGFGVEVAERLRGRRVPDGVRVLDIGIRGIHLAYELLDGCALLILVDAAPHGTPPGTVSVIEVDAHTPSPGRPLLDGHGLAPDDVFALLDQMGGRPARTLVVACEPHDVSPGIGLSPAVASAVPEAVRAVEQLLRPGAAGAGSGRSRAPASQPGREVGTVGSEPWKEGSR